MFLANHNALSLFHREQIKSMKEYIAINQSKNSKQAESKRKVLAKMERQGLTAKPEVEKMLNFQFVSATRMSFYLNSLKPTFAHLQHTCFFLNLVGSWPLATSSAGIPRCQVWLSWMRATLH